MKQKTFYIFAFICCISLFSAAKQSGKKCDGLCKNTRMTCPNQELPKAKERRTAYDVSTLSFFINI